MEAEIFRSFFGRIEKKKSYEMPQEVKGGNSQK